MLKGILKKIYCLYCGFNRWLERVKEILCVFMCLLIAQVFFKLFTVFVVISCELDTLNLY